MNVPSLSEARYVPLLKKGLPLEIQIMEYTEQFVPIGTGALITSRILILSRLGWYILRSIGRIPLENLETVLLVKKLHRFLEPKILFLYLQELATGSHSEFGRKYSTAHTFITHFSMTLFTYRSQFRFRC
jgi:hypothetical protein